MYDFYKKALIALLCLAAASVLIGYACFQRSHATLRLLPAHASALPWQAVATTDAPQGGDSTLRIASNATSDATSSGQLRFQFRVGNVVDHPFVTAALMFRDRDGKPVHADLSRYTTLSFTAKCAPANTLTLAIPTFDPKVSTPGNLLSYRTPSAFFACNNAGARTELDLTRMETAQWWFDMFKLDLSYQAYRLDRVAGINIGSTFQSPRQTDSTVDISDLVLHGREFNYLYALAAFLIFGWGGYGLWFVRQHTRVLIADVKNKLQRDLPLVTRVLATAGVQDQLEFFAAVSMIMMGTGFTLAGNTQNRVGAGVEQVNRRVHGPVEQVQRHGGPQRQGLGLADGPRLGCQFTDHDMQVGNDKEGGKERYALDHFRRRHADGAQQRLQDVRKRRLADPAKAQRGQGNTQLAGRQVGVELTVYGAQDLPAPAVVFGNCLNPGGTQFDHGKFRRNEKTVEQYQDQSKKNHAEVGEE